MIAIDSDFTDDSTFTSLCNIYLVHNTLTEVEIYNFNEKNYYQFMTKQIYTGNLMGNDFINKERFQKSFFPDFNWSRKGFLHTKWRIKNRTFNFVNVHLFHDASNLVALSQSPSMYSENRRKALKYTVERVGETQGPCELGALFGDFNFRLDLAKVIGQYTRKGGNCGSECSGRDWVGRVFTDANENEIFLVGEKKFQWNGAGALEEEVEHLVKLDNEVCEV